MSIWRVLNLKDFGILGCPEAIFSSPAGTDHSPRIGVLGKRYAQGSAWGAGATICATKFACRVQKGVIEV